jgi:hypothetical protein
MKDRLKELCAQLKAAKGVTGAGTTLLPRVTSSSSSRYGGLTIRGVGVGGGGVWGVGREALL